MPELVWDAIEDRTYETGLDKGVLYLPDGSAVPWNGLTSVIEHFDSETYPVYYDGMKINELVVLGDFSASLRAVTYPEKFVELEGLGQVKHGLFYADQSPQSFGLCYRSQIGNALDGDVIGHKIHIIYNVVAIPSDKTYASAGSEPSLVEFEWNISAVPEEVPGFRPTAHIIINSDDIDPWLMEELEEILYGSIAADAVLLPMEELVTYIADWARIHIVDNGDGTWTATTTREGFISFGIDGFFQIVGANAIFTDDHTFVISDTVDIADVPQIKITEVEGGYWNAVTESEGLIVMIDDHEFEIRNATAVFLNDHTYQISDTVDDS